MEGSLTGLCLTWAFKALFPPKDLPPPSEFPREPLSSVALPCLLTLLTLRLREDQGLNANWLALSLLLMQAPRRRAAWGSHFSWALSLPTKLGLG